MFLMGVMLLLIVLLVSFIPMLVVYKVLQAYSSSFEFFIFGLSPEILKIHFRHPEKRSKS